MIRVDRGEEPPALREVRWWRLARAVIARQTGAPIEFEGYNTAEVRRALYDRQHGKCAYCEMWIQRDAVPIEHFRPKSHAVRHVSEPEPVDPDRYWWLAWSWENLFLACTTCNSPARKGNRFPLADGAAPCAPGPGTACAAPVVDADEPALLVDPGRHDPIAEIRFRRQGEEWVPTGRDNSARGLATVEVLHLDERDGLVDKYVIHVTSFVQPAIERIRAAVKSNPAALREVWRLEVSGLLYAEGQQFRGLAYDVFVEAFDEAFRKQHGLPLPRPGARARPITPPTDQPADHLAGLPDELVWRIRAIGPANSKGHAEALREALAALCGHRPHSVSAMADVTRVARPRVEAAVSALVAQGRLVASGGRYATPAERTGGNR